MVQGKPTLILLSIFILFFYVQATLWENRFPNPTESNYLAGVFALNKFELVGNEGSIIASADGYTWDPCMSAGDG